MAGGGLGLREGEFVPGGAQERTEPGLPRRAGSARSGHCGRGAGKGRPGVVRSLGPPGAGPGRTAPWQRRPLSSCPLGERLCSTEEATAGSGTYTRHGFIFSSLAGCLEKRSEDSGVSTDTARAPPFPGASHGGRAAPSRVGNWALRGLGRCLLSAWSHLILCAGCVPS